MVKCGEESEPTLHSRFYITVKENLSQCEEVKCFEIICHEYFRYEKPRYT